MCVQLLESFIYQVLLCVFKTGCKYNKRGKKLSETRFSLNHWGCMHSVAYIRYIKRSGTLCKEGIQIHMVYLAAAAGLDMYYFVCCRLKNDNMCVCVIKCT